MEQDLFKYISQHITLTDAESDELRKLEIMEPFRKGELLLRAGEYSNKTYYVRKGCIRSYYLVDGEEKTTAFYVENEPILPVCVTTQKASEYFLSCVEDSVLQVSTPDMEQAFFEKFPRFHNICRVFSEQMSARNQMSFDRYMNSTPEQRYLFIMKERPDLLNRVPNYQLASFIGVMPESLSRIRKRLSQKRKE